MVRHDAFLLCAAALCSLATAGVENAPAESIELVISKEAGDLEQFAASELQRYLGRLFHGAAAIVASPSDKADCLFLLGTPQRHPGRALGEEAFPQLSDQGFLLRKANRRTGG